MRKSALFVILVVALLLAGCAKQEVGKEESTENIVEKVEEIVEPEIANPFAEKIAEFSDTIVSKLVTGGDDFLIYPSQSTANEEKEGFFVIGLRNNMPSEQQYRVKLEAVRAHTVGGLANSLPMDDAALSWFKSSNDYGPYTITNPGLGKYSLDNGIKIATIYYNVLDKSSKTDKTQKGNYVFKVIIERLEEGHIWREMTGNSREISVKYV